MLNDESDDDDQPTEAVLREIEFMKMRAEKEAEWRATNKATIRAALWIYVIVAIIVASGMVAFGNIWWASILTGLLWPGILVFGMFARIGG